MENLFYNEYLKKDLGQIENDLYNHKQFSLQGRIALLRVIKDKGLEKILDQDLIDQLNKSIQTEIDSIKELKQLTRLGIDIFERHNSFEISKSNSAYLRDFLSLLISLFLVLILVFSIVKWIGMVKTGIEILEVIPFSISLAIGFFGFLLLVKTIDRIFFFNRFSVKKNNGRIFLSYKPDYNVEEFEFHEGSKLAVEEIDTNANLIIEDNDTKTRILHFKNVDFISSISLRKLVERFNAF